MDFPENFRSDIEAVAKINEIPTIFEVIRMATGMRFSAVARVTEDRWVTCCVEDGIDFGFSPGTELPIENTFCNRIRQNLEPVVFDDSVTDQRYKNDPVARLYSFRSYVSVPIVLPDGSFFGTLCGLDSEPRSVSDGRALRMFELFAQMIAYQLQAQKDLTVHRLRLSDERQTSELREQFIAVLGHDLRNPLASISAGMNLIAKEPISDRARSVLALMGTSVSRMGHLIDDVMDFARGRLGGGIALNKTSGSLRSTIEHVIEEIRTAHPSSEIEHTLDVSDPFPGDHERLAQLLSNLLGNAVSHGNSLRPIRVIARQDGRSIELSVINDGNPIPPDAMERLFQPFYRNKAMSSREGLGLGLFIASEIARAHGGHIEVASDEAETRFTFRAPTSETFRSNS